MTSSPWIVATRSASASSAGPVAELVERGRTQLGDEVTQLRDAGGHLLGGRRDGLAHLAEILEPSSRAERELEAAELLERLVVQLARPAGAFALGRLDAALAGLGGYVLGSGHGRGRRGRERLHQAPVLHPELWPIDAAVECRQHTDPAAAEDQRDDQPGGGVQVLAEAEPHLTLDLGEPFGASRPEHVADDRVLDGHLQPQHGRFDLPGRSPADQLVTLGEQQHHRGRFHERAAPLDDQLEYPVEIRLGAERPRDGARGLQGPYGALELSPLRLLVPVEVRVVDRGGRPAGRGS